MPDELIVVAADKSMQLTLQTLLLNRHHALGFRQLFPDSVEVIVQGNHDSAVFLAGHEVLRSQVNRVRHALLICDRSGCGREDLSRDELEMQMEDRLNRSGWGDRAKAVVIDPELEIWFWVQSPHVGDVVGWRGRQPSLQQWLRQEGFLAAGALKPHDPKAALDRCLRVTQKRRSSAIFQQLAARVSLQGCSDPAFLKLVITLKSWFPRQFSQA